MKYLAIGLIVSLVGCASKPIVVPNANNLVAPVVAVPAVNKEVRVELYFDFDSYEVKDKEVLNRIASSLENTVVKVTGYCDEIGTEEYNDALGLRRAQAVAKILNDISGIGMEILSKGKSEAHHTDDQSIRQSDRKVTIIT